MVDGTALTPSTFGESINNGTWVPKDAADIAAGNIVAGKFSLYRKPTGYVSVPVYKNYGKRTIQRLQNVCDAIFVKGIPPESFVA